jgi:hypothetical protein
MRNEQGIYNEKMLLTFIIPNVGLTKSCEI